MSGSKNQVIIGVDDVRENLLVLQALTEWAGYTFFPAPGGLECLSLLTRLVPRLILLDVQMPWMDGFETCRKLRSMEDMASVPVAFLTVRNSIEDVRDGKAAGGNDFIIKPVEPAILLERITYWTARRAPPPNVFDWMKE